MKIFAIAIAIIVGMNVIGAIASSQYDPAPCAKTGRMR